jgi:hypothetical protein
MMNPELLPLQKCLPSASILHVYVLSLLQLLTLLSHASFSEKVRHDHWSGMYLGYHVIHQTSSQLPWQPHSLISGTFFNIMNAIAMSILTIALHVTSKSLTGCQLDGKIFYL